jgi:hypothetical protein
MRADGEVAFRLRRHGAESTHDVRSRTAANRLEQVALQAPRQCLGPRQSRRDRASQRVAAGGTGDPPMVTAPS